MPVKPDPVITVINRYRAASAELDKIAVREPTLPNGSPADETEEYAVWETARLKAQDVAATAWAEVTAAQPTTVAGAIALINCYLEIWSEHPIRAEHQASGSRQCGAIRGRAGKSLFARDCVVGPRGLELRAKHAVLSNESLIHPG